jgi:predicted GNAT superfamily acetyltransferase
VGRVLAGKEANVGTSKRAVRITIPANIEELRSNDPTQARQIQSEVRTEFLRWLGKGYAATGVKPGKGGMDYLLEPGSSI